MSTAPDRNGSSSAERAVPRAMLRPAGADGGRGWRIAMLAAGLALAGALAWWGWCAAGPLAVPAAGSAPSAPRLPEPGAGPSRQGVGEALASLQRNNLFSVDRALWPLTADAAAGNANAGNPGGSSVATGANGAPTVVKGPGDLRVTPTESAPEKVRKALEAIALRGIRSSASGDLALISFPLEATDNPLRSRSFAVGSTFSESKNPDDQWRLEAIDRVTDTVYLSRAGVTVALDVFRGGRRSAGAVAGGGDGVGSAPGLTAAQPGAALAGSGVPSGTQGAGPTIQSLTFDQIEAELRAAGLSEADIADLMARARSTPTPSAPGEPPALAEEPKPVVPQGMPAGMEEIIRMMASGEAPVSGGSATPVEDAPAPEPQGDE